MADPVMARYENEDYGESVMLNGGQRRAIDRIIEEELEANGELSDSVEIAELGAGYCALIFTSRNTGQAVTKRMLFPLYGD